MYIGSCKDTSHSDEDQFCVGKQSSGTLMYVVVPEGMKQKMLVLYYISHIDLHKLLFNVHFVFMDKCYEC